MGRKFKKIELGEVIGDMYVYAEEQDIKNNRRMLKCRCLKCNREKLIYEGNYQNNERNGFGKIKNSAGWIELDKGIKLT